MSDKIVYITVGNAGVIPFLNRRGPLNSPIAISETIALNLKAMGYAIKFHKRNNVKVDLDSGVREFVSSNGKNVEPNGHKAEEVLTTNVVEDVLDATEPKDVTPETDDDLEPVEEPTDVITEEDSNEQPVTDSDEDSTEIEVYSESHYASWTKSQLATYLRKLDAYLPDEVVAKIGSSNKTQLLAIIKEHIIDPSA